MFHNTNEFIAFSTTAFKIRFNVLVRLLNGQYDIIIFSFRVFDAKFNVSFAKLIVLEELKKYINL